MQGFFLCLESGRQTHPESPTNKTLVQEQFGKTAATYLASTPPALGKSLERLVALISPQKTWRAVAAHT